MQKKMLLAAFFAGAAMPAHSAEIFIEGSFGPTSEIIFPPYSGPPSPAANFALHMTFTNPPTEQFEATYAPSAVTFTFGDFTAVDFYFPQFRVTGISAIPFVVSGRAIDADGKSRGFQFILDATGQTTALGGFYQIVSFGNEGGQTEFVYRNPTFTKIQVDQSLVDLPPPAVKAVPEPTSWALTIGGLALTGAAMRRRVKVTFA